jgi:hypothetical protein
LFYKENHELRYRKWAWNDEPSHKDGIANMQAAIPFCMNAGRHGLRGLLESRRLGQTSAVRSLCLPGSSAATPFEPILSEQLYRMLRALRAVSAIQGISRTVLIASPADALGMLWMDGKFFRHVW